MLKHPIPGTRRMAIGLALAGSVIVGTAYAAWATRPANRVYADAAAAAAGPTTQPVSRSQAEPVAQQRAGAQADATAHVHMQSKMMAPPRYPVDAAANKITGKVVMIIDVAADGGVVDARVEKSEPAGVFDQVTLDAVKNWRFEPAMKDGKPVAGRVRVPVYFEMDRDEDGRAKAASSNA